MNHSRNNLSDHICRLILRYFRNGAKTAISSPNIKLQEDLDYLRLHWAISNSVCDLVQYLHTHKDEVQASITFTRRTSSTRITGRILPTETILARRLSGDLSQVCFDEPSRTFQDGPNYVLAWVLQLSRHVLIQKTRLAKTVDSYLMREQLIAGLIAKLTRLSGIGHAIQGINIPRRPSDLDLKQAAMSPKALYRKAYTAYTLLRKVEACKDDTLAYLLNDTLIEPLYDWQKFELLVALRLTEALSEIIEEPLILHPITPGAQLPIASTGCYDVYWQSRSPFWCEPILEPSEKLVESILSAYGQNAGVDRPDIVVCDRNKKKVVSIAEAKYSDNDGGASGRLRNAIEQLVKYSKLYRNGIPQSELLKQSVLAVVGYKTNEYCNKDMSKNPLAYGLEDFLTSNLQAWANRIAAKDSA